MSETLVGRQEKQGRYFPMWLERILLVLTIFAMYLFHSDIGDFFQSQGTPTWLTFIIEWCLLPISLLVLSELISRIMQAVHSD